MNFKFFLLTGILLCIVAATVVVLPWTLLYVGMKSEADPASPSEQYADGSSAAGIITAEELLQKFHIKLISWEYAEPIENTFLE